MVDPDRPDGPLDDDLDALAALQDPVRRSLYRYVALQAGDVSREEAATAIGIQRALAAFHLDKLVEGGLLDVDYRRLTGRTGPGAGRPAKVYRRTSRQHHVSLPPRRYDLAGELLAEAVEEAGGRPVAASVTEVARRFGRGLGQDVRAGLRARASRERRLSAVLEALEGYGYEPRRERRTVVLGNCPFHALAERHRRLVCGMNLSLLQGVVDGMGSSDLEARPDPEPGRCCVSVVVKDKET